MKESVGRPATLKAVVAAHTPGTGMTLKWLSKAAAIKRYPGSETVGVPALLTSAMDRPFCSLVWCLLD